MIIKFQNMSWTDGSPLSHQLWINRHTRGIRITYTHRYHKIRQNPKKWVPSFCRLNISSSVRKLSIYIDVLTSEPLQPMNEHRHNLACEVMMMDNLADPEWISVPCLLPTIHNIICVDTISQEAKLNQSNVKL